MIYHVEKRPSEEGRSVLVRTEQGTDVIGRDFNSRTSVHEVRLLMSSGLERISHKIVDSMVELPLSCITVLRTSPIRKMLDSIE